jgi:N-acetylglucosamine-6-phosphate deacetylase
VDVFRGWQDVAHGLICRSALAPEREGSLAYISQLADLGVACALGHSDATYEQGLAAVSVGANSFVHTYNAMSPLHHRNPGLVGCAMSTPDTYSELICDGKHVSPGAAMALIRAKGWQHVALITDCLACGGMPEGEYELGGQQVYLKDGIAKLADGTIAGAATNLFECMKNAILFGIEEADAVRAATFNPACALGAQDKVGSIATGKYADFIVCRSDYTGKRVFMSGKEI